MMRRLYAHIMDATRDVPPMKGRAWLEPVQPYGKGQVWSIVLASKAGIELIDTGSTDFSSLDCSEVNGANLSDICTVAWANNPDVRLAAAVGREIHLWNIVNRRWSIAHTHSDPITALSVIGSNNNLELAFGDQAGLTIRSTSIGRNRPIGQTADVLKRIRGPITAMRPIRNTSQWDLLVCTQGRVSSVNTMTDEVTTLGQLAGAGVDQKIHSLDVLARTAVFSGNFMQYGVGANWSNGRSVLRWTLGGTLEGTGETCEGKVNGIAMLDSKCIIAVGEDVPVKSSGIAYFDGKSWFRVDDPKNDSICRAACRAGNTIYVATNRKEPLMDLTEIWEIQYR